MSGHVVLSKKRDPKLETPKPVCVCGCGRPARKRGRYASPSCWMRTARIGNHRPKRASQNPQHLFPERTRETKAPKTESWWLGLSREELNAEAHRRHPTSSDDTRVSMPKSGARGAFVKRKSA